MGVHAPRTTCNRWAIDGLRAPRLLAAHGYSARKEPSGRIVAVRQSALEGVVMGEALSGLPFRQFWTGKRVLLTGHTGFKGSWLALWLARLGADVAGYALPP